MLNHPALKAHKGFLCLFAANLVVLVACGLYEPLRDILSLKHTDWNGFPTAMGLITLFTHTFTHANFSHFFGNFLFTMPFAVYLERKIGTKKFLATWFACGLGAATLFMLTPTLFPWTGCLGASGACFGIMTAACMMIDEHPFLKSLAFFILGALTLPQYQMTIVSAFIPIGIAFSAHLGGFITALLLTPHLKD